ncbi:hypothetical protein M0D21_07875 [Aquimarina sp. D1M17]|uniref:hypothetical protein n=1 Tax=Aquimarina acroporae TaxID=2937283 RepID=UPI0020BE7033|nr:hypothetical protein [Aquimarina acroporae]MCK8521481.1 hypothetical protein [Aquimarina acroporae]
MAQEYDMTVSFFETRRVCIKKMTYFLLDICSAINTGLIGKHISELPNVVLLEDKNQLNSKIYLLEEAGYFLNQQYQSFFFKLMKMTL